MHRVKLQPDADGKGDALADFKGEHVALCKLRLHRIVGILDEQADHIHRPVREGEIEDGDILLQVGGGGLHRLRAPAVEQHMGQHRLHQAGLMLPLDRRIVVALAHDALLFGCGFAKPLHEGLDFTFIHQIAHVCHPLGI